MSDGTAEKKDAQSGVELIISGIQSNENDRDRIENIHQQSKDGAFNDIGTHSFSQISHFRLAYQLRGRRLSQSGQ